MDVAIGWRGCTERFRHADGPDDFLDLGIRRLLNRLIAGAGYACEVCDALGMPNVVLVLTPAEQGRLVRERGWSFYDL